MYNVHCNIYYYYYPSMLQLKWTISNQVKSSSTKSRRIKRKNPLGPMRRSACCVQHGTRWGLEWPRFPFRCPTNHGSFLLLVSLARALPPASTRPFLPARPATINTSPDRTHGRRCTRTTTAQVCAFTCQWKSPLENRKKSRIQLFSSFSSSSYSSFNF